MENMHRKPSIITNDTRLVGLNNKPLKPFVDKSDIVYDNYKKAYEEAVNAPVPAINLMHSEVLVRACPPKMNHTTKGGIIINDVELDDYLTQDKLDKMSQNVSDEQEVLIVGQWIQDREENYPEDKKLKPGMKVKIDFRRYKTLKDNHVAGIIETTYDIPMFKIDGHKYLLIDDREILWSRN